MTDTARTSSTDTTVPEAFIARWRKSAGAERANYQFFISEVCDLLGVERPEPSTELDAAIAEAYGWPADLPNEEIFTRLVDLNHQRAAKEAQGIIRYLRPEYQNPAIKPKPEERKATQQNLLSEEPPSAAPKAGKAANSTKGGKEKPRQRNKVNSRGRKRCQSRLKLCRLLCRS